MPLSFFFLCLFSSCATLPFLKTDAEYYEEKINSFNAPPDVVVLDTESSQNINRNLPDEVYVKTLSQTFMKGWQFILRDGRIYAKEDGSDEWKLLVKNGKPKEAERLCEIYADGDCLFAFDNKGRLFKMYFQKTTSEKTFKWIKNFGWPQKTQLYKNELVRSSRSWAMGTRRRDVLWYEDAFGNQHHYGTMGLETIYFLCEDGQHILFTDSGLPNDYSKSIEGPENGKFIARNISNSASTIFLIGDSGTMYTRLIDFDTMGCDPMFFKYTYVKTEQKRKGTEYLSNYDAWGLPAEGWKKEPGITLNGKARLSRFITIFQNGQGNFARELRVAGTGENGETGFYYKQISDSDWKFKSVPLNIKEEEFLSGGKEYGDTTEYSYSGYVSLNQEKTAGLTVSTEDFPLNSEGQFNLRFTMSRNGWSETKTVKCYNVAQWTYTTRIDPGHDGTALYYFITPDFDETLFNTEREEFGALLKTIFDGSNKKTFVFTGEATDAYLEIYGYSQAGRRNQFDIFMASYADSSAGEALPDSTVYKAFNTYMNYLNGEEDNTLILPEKTVFTMDDFQEIADAIAKNENYERLLNGELKATKKYSRKANVSRWSYNFVDLLTTITLINQINFPKIKTMTSYGGRLLKSNYQNYSSTYEYRSMTGPHIISLTDVRIKAYKKLLNDVRSGGRGVLPKQLETTYTGYFNVAGIPATLDGNCVSAKKPAVFQTIPEMPMYPGFILQIGDGDSGQDVNIVAQKAAKTIFARKEELNTSEGLIKKPLKLKVKFIPLKGESKYLGQVGGINFLGKKSGKLTWNGETLKIQTGHFFTKKTLFEGKTSD